MMMFKDITWEPAPSKLMRMAHFRDAEGHGWRIYETRNVAFLNPIDNVWEDQRTWYDVREPGGFYRHAKIEVLELMCIIHELGLCQDEEWGEA